MNLRPPSLHTKQHITSTLRSNDTVLHATPPKQIRSTGSASYLAINQVRVFAACTGRRRGQNALNDNCETRTTCCEHHNCSFNACEGIVSACLSHYKTERPVPANALQIRFQTNLIKQICCMTFPK